MDEYERGFIDGIKSKVSAELTPTLIDISKTMLEMLKPVLSTALENALNDNNAITETDVQPVKRGRWIKCDYKRLDDAGEVQTYIGQGVYCSKCRTGFHKNEVKNWIGCPCCLTRMDGDANG